MRVLFGIGLVVLILGFASLAIPIPHYEREAVTVGGVSLGVESRHSERVSPALSAVMILAGVGAMVAARRKPA